MLYIKTGELPKNVTRLKQFVAIADNYIIENNILYHLQKPPARVWSDVFRKQLAVCNSLRTEILSACHEEIHPDI